jgi:sugar lactone lactonase YvrE
MPANSLTARVALGAALLLITAAPVHPLGLDRVGTIVPSGTEIGLFSPSALWYDGQRDLLVVANPNAHHVLLLNLQGVVVKTLGKRGDLRFPRAVAASRGGTLYIGGRESEMLRVLPEYDSGVGEEYRTVDLSPYRRKGPVQPVALFVDEGANLYVADRGNRQILVFGVDEKLRFSIPDVGEPTDLVVDRGGKILVSDPGFGGVRAYDERGRFLRTLGTSPVQFREPLRGKALAVDRRGRIWVAEEAGRGIKAIDTLGNLIFSYSGESLFAPVDLAIDARENLYVLEEGGNRISVFRIAGI